MKVNWRIKKTEIIRQNIERFLEVVTIRENFVKNMSIIVD